MERISNYSDRQINSQSVDRSSLQRQVSSDQALLDRVRKREKLLMEKEAEAKQLENSFPNWARTGRDYLATLCALTSVVRIANGSTPYADRHYVNGRLITPSIHSQLVDDIGPKVQVIGFVGAIACQLGGQAHQKIAECFHPKKKEFTQLKTVAEQFEKKITQEEYEGSRNDFINWLKKILKTKEANIEPGKLSQRLANLCEALTGEPHSASERDSTAQDELRKKCFDIAAAYIADCHDASCEALDKMEMEVHCTKYKDLSQIEFIHESRKLFRTALLEEVADIICKKSSDSKKDKEELEVFSALKSLLKEELDLDGTNLYMQFRQIGSVTDDELLKVVRMVNDADTDKNFSEFLAKNSWFKSYLKENCPRYKDWCEKHDENFSNFYYEASSITDESKQIDAVSKINDRKQRNEEIMLRGLALDLIQKCASKDLDMLYRNKAIPGLNV